MTQPKIWTPSPDNSLIALTRRIRIRPRVPPRARVGVSYEPQYLHWQVVNPDGSIAQEGEQHNLLLNGYKSLVPTYGFVGQDSFVVKQNLRGKGLAEYAVVGTGSTAPDPTQTTLDAEVARTANWTKEDSVLIVSDGVYDLKYVREFPAGSFNDTPLTEWGFSPSGTPGDPLMSRELFRDAAGNPISVVVSNTQTLRFYYYVRVTLSPNTPQPASVTINGIGTLTGQAFLQRATAGGDYPAGPLELANAIAMGLTNPTTYKTNYYGSYAMATVIQEGILKATLGTAFTSQTYSPSRATKTASYNPPGPNSRSTQPIVFSANEAVATIYGFILGMYETTNYVMTGRYVFLLDAGQEFTKDNLHTLTVDPITLTW